MSCVSNCVHLFSTPPPRPRRDLTLQVCEWSRNWWRLTLRWSWCGCPRPGFSRIATSLCCVTWRRWAAGWSTGPRPYSTVSTSSGPFRSWPATGCLSLTPSPTVTQCSMFVCLTLLIHCASIIYNQQWMDNKWIYTLSIHSYVTSMWLICHTSFHTNADTPFPLEVSITPDHPSVSILCSIYDRLCCLGYWYRYIKYRFYEAKSI